FENSYTEILPSDLHRHDGRVTPSQVSKDEIKVGSSDVSQEPARCKEVLEAAVRESERQRPVGNCQTQVFQRAQPGLDLRPRTSLAPFKCRYQVGARGR